tara:strand:- start:519 stop:785 length:267 start_codon:yes stop_codon:yes gene_type:complete
MKFVNKNNQELKTILSDEIMTQVGDIVESKLKEKGIYYTRDGSKFDVKDEDILTVINTQTEATMELVDKGVITYDMIIEDLKANNLIF